MKNSIMKLTALVLVVLLALTGCSMIKVDPEMQAAEDAASKAKRDAVVVAEFDGGTVTQGEADRLYTQQYSYLAYMYSLYNSYMGANTYSITADDIASMRTDTLKVLAQTKIQLLKYDELGAAALTDEETTTIAADAQKQIDDYLANYQTDEEKETALASLETSQGYTLDSLIQSATESKKIEKLKELVTKDITVTEDDVKAAFDEKVAADQTTYEGNYSTFENAMTNADKTVYWMPEGYRTVKHILLKPSDDALLTNMNTISSSIESVNAHITSLTTTSSEDATPEPTVTPSVTSTPDVYAAMTLDELNAELTKLNGQLEEAKAAILADVQPKIDEINAALESGTAFEDLIEQYTGDTASNSEPVKTRGYYVCENSTSWDGAFKDAALSLANVGDVAAPTVGRYGVHLVKYESDVTPGAVEYDTVSEALTEETLQTKKDEYYTEQSTGWYDAANIVYHEDLWTA